MLFRATFSVALLALVLNIGEIFNLERANAIEKSLLLLAAFTLLLRGRIAWSVVTCVVFVLLSTLISAVFTVYSGFAWDIYFRSLASLAAALLFLVVIPSRSDSEFILLTFVFLPVFEIAVSALYQIRFGISMFRVDGLLGDMRLAGTTHPAFLAPLAVAGAFAAVFLADLKNKLYLVMTVVNGIILLLTAARMPALVFTLCCGSALIFCFQGQHSMRLFILLTGPIAASIVGLIFSERIMARLEYGSLSGREVLWNYLRNVSDHYPAFGIGLGHQSTIMGHETMVLNPTIAAHNEYIRLLVEVGWIGSALMIFAGVALFTAIWSSRWISYNPIFLVSVIAFAIYSYTDNTLSRFEANAILIVALIGCATVHQFRKIGIAHQTPSRLQGVGRLAKR